jgi:hypothetical protein
MGLVQVTVQIQVAVQVHVAVLGLDARVFQFERRRRKKQRLLLGRRIRRLLIVIARFPIKSVAIWSVVIAIVALRAAAGVAPVALRIAPCIVAVSARGT